MHFIGCRTRSFSRFPSHFLLLIPPPPPPILSPTRARSRMHVSALHIICPPRSDTRAIYTHTGGTRGTGLHARRNKIIASALRSKVNLLGRGGGRAAVELTFAWPALSSSLYCRAGIDLRESRNLALTLDYYLKFETNIYIREYFRIENSII